MKKLLLLLLSFPILASAENRDAEITSSLAKVIQPIGVMDLVQGDMKVSYKKDEKNLTDKLIYTVGKKTWSTKGPWSLASKNMRAKVRTCKNSHPGTKASGCGWYDYSIVRLSPSGKYIELNGQGYESQMWRMLDTQSSKIILSNDNGVKKSMWTQDKKQFVWQTYDCEIGGCLDETGIFITVVDKFPLYNLVSANNQIETTSNDPKQVLQKIGFPNLTGYSQYLKQLHSYVYQGLAYDICENNEDGCVGDPDILTMTLQKDGTYLVEFSYIKNPAMVNFLRGYVNLDLQTFRSVK